MSAASLLSAPVASPIDFYKAVLDEGALANVTQSLLGNTTGGGKFSAVCHALLRQAVPEAAAYLTTSCTDALELAALALDVKAGDEIVMPSWTFPSTANAFALRGATPVFVDVHPGTLNIDPVAAANAITPKTRALVCVHYAGVACDMERLKALAREANLPLVEDAAQGYGAFWKDKRLGGIGELGTFSFHGTKNVSCGEGGALMVMRDDLVARVEVAWQKGTNFLSYSRGEVDRYEWCGLGSSFIPSEVTAALLAAQLSATAKITVSRRLAWARYAALLKQAGSPQLELPEVPSYARHNGHIFAVRLREPHHRQAVLNALSAAQIDARTHYEPLHLAPAGRLYGRTYGSLQNTEHAAGSLIRLPLHTLLTFAEQERVVDVLLTALAAVDRL